MIRSLFPRRPSSCVAILIAAIGCTGAHRSPATSPARAARAARVEVLAPGTRINLERTVEARIAGEVSAPRRDVIYLEIVRRRDDGRYEADAVFVAIRSEERVGRARFRLTLAPDLTLWGDPERVCSDLGPEHAPERALHHVLGAVPRAPPGTEGEFGAEYRTDVGPPTLRARGRVTREGHSVRVRAEARVRLEGALLGTIAVDGPLRVRIAADTDETFLRGRVRTRIEGRATSGEAFRIDERIEGFTASGSIPESESCRPEDFDVRMVLRAIRTSQSAIRACYDRELRQDRTVRGTVRVTMSIEPDGQVTNVRVTESTIPGDHGVAIADCVVRVISGFHFDPGPDGGAVTYTFPFVFEPGPR